MKGFLSLVIIVAGLFVTWTNREKFIHLLSKGDTVPAETAETKDTPDETTRRSAATPHPAREAQAQATALYPGLSIPNSALNQKFVALYKEAQASHSPLLSHPDWPLTLAERSVVALGGAPMPRNSSPQARAAKAVVIYTTSHCPYCKQAKQYFAQNRIPYREIDVETSLTGKEAYRKLGGDGVPLIMVGDKKVQGFDQKELDRLLL
jgi:glutaredoxin